MIERQLSYIEVGFIDEAKEVMRWRISKEDGRKEKTYEKSTIANITK